MPLEYVEPKKWKNKRKIEFPIWTEAAKKETEVYIDEIPEGAEAKIKIEFFVSIKTKSLKKEKRIKRKEETAVPFMGHWEYDVLKGIIEKTGIKPGDKWAKIEIFWNERQALLEEREIKLLKQFNKILKKA